jgi:hypothetical protein
MADRAVRQLPGWIDVVFHHQPAAEFSLRNRRLPTHRKNFLTWAQVILRSTMAIQTPFHMKGSELPCQGHLIEPAMTRLASHSSVDMYAVIEINKIGRVVHAIPCKRPILTKAGSNRLEHGAVVPHLFVTVHAHFGGGNSCKRDLFHRDVAIPAINAQAGNVMLMTERNRLFAYYVLPGHVRRTNETCPSPCDDCDNEDAPEDRDAGYRIQAAMKDLRHRESAVATVLPE